MFRGLLLLQGLDQDVLHTTHVNQVHLQSPAAHRIEAFGGVALTQAKEFVALPDPGPWEGPVKQPVCEDGYCRAQLRRAALDPLRCPESVGTQLGRIVLGVSGSATARPTRVDLDQASPVVDAHQLEAQPDLHLLSRRAQGRRYRVEGVLAGHVVIGMHFGVAPVGDLVGLAVPGMQGLSFRIQEDLQGLTPGGAVDAPSRDISTPACRLIPEVSQILELSALEEALAYVLDTPLHLGLVLGVAHPGRVGDEASMLGVFQKATGQAGVQCVSACHSGGEVVDDQIFGNAAEEGPGRFQAGDHLLQLLPVGGPQEAVPGVSQHHYQGPHRAAAARLLVLDEAQASEVQFRHLSRPALLHPHRSGAATSPVAPLQETPQRRVRHLTAPLGQQFANAGHLQPVNGDPSVDLIAPGLQQVLGGRRFLPWSAPAQGYQPAQLFLTGVRPFPAYPNLFRCRQVFPDGISR